MFRLSILVTLVCVATASAVKSHCCSLTKYSGLMLQISGMYYHGGDRAHATTGQVEMNFDYDRRMVVQVFRNLGPMTLIFDYGNSKLHIVLAGDMCITRYLNPDLLLSPCDPGNFTLNAEYGIGSPDNRVAVEEFAGLHGTYFMSLIATKDDCIPVTLAMYGQNEDKTADEVHAFLFTDVQPHVVDESAFNIPSACAANEKVHIKKRDVEELIGMRLPF